MTALPKNAALSFACAMHPRPPAHAHPAAIVALRLDAPAAFIPVTGAKKHVEKPASEQDPEESLTPIMPGEPPQRPPAHGAGRRKKKEEGQSPSRPGREHERQHAHDERHRDVIGSGEAAAGSLRSRPDRRAWPGHTQLTCELRRSGIAFSSPDIPTARSGPICVNTLCRLFRQPPNPEPSPPNPPIVTIHDDRQRQR